MSRTARGVAVLAALLLAGGCGGAEEPDRRAAAPAPSADTAGTTAADTSFPLRRAPADTRRDRAEFEPPEPPPGAAGPASEPAL